MAELDYNTVVVVDGDSDTIDALGASLRDRGLRPVIVRSGTQAMKRVQQEKPGAVILELALPDRDGCQVIKEIKDDWDIKKTAIVILSDYPNRLDRASREKVEAVFSKPTDLPQFVDDVARIMARVKAS